MVFTLFNEKTLNERYILNTHKIKRIRNKLLLTTQHGGWVLLTKKEYSQLLKYQADKSILLQLEEKGIIITERNVDLILEYQSRRTKFLLKGTSLHIIVSTLRCNNCCVYCHSSVKPEKDSKYDLDKKTAKKIVEFIFQTNSPNVRIEFQGGETTLNFEIVKYVVTEAKKLSKKIGKDVEFMLVSNLGTITKEQFDYLSKEQFIICTSIDGPKDVHDKNRYTWEKKGTYDDVKENLKDNKMGTLMVTTRHSLPNWNKIVDEYIRLDNKIIHLKYINKIGFAKNTWEKIGYTVEEYLLFWRKSVDYMLELNKRGIHIKERMVNLALQKVTTTSDPGFLDWRAPCGMIIGQLTYDYNGDIYTCDEGRSSELFKLGNVKENNYKEIVTKKESQQLIASSILENYLCDNCEYKPYCGTCPVINYSEEGNIIPKLPLNSKCIIQKAKLNYLFDKIAFDNSARKIFISWFNNWNERNDIHSHELEE